MYKFLWTVCYAILLVLWLSAAWLLETRLQQMDNGKPDLFDDYDECVCISNSKESQNYKYTYKNRVAVGKKSLTWTSSWVWRCRLNLLACMCKKKLVVHLYFFNMKESVIFLYGGPPAGWSRAALFFPAGDMRVSCWPGWTHLATTSQPFIKSVIT